jgi:hypothetical protein
MQPVKREPSRERQVKPSEAAESARWLRRSALLVTAASILIVIYVVLWGHSPNYDWHRYDNATATHAPAGADSSFDAEELRAAGDAGRHLHHPTSVGPRDRQWERHFFTKMTQRYAQKAPHEVAAPVADATSNGEDSYAIAKWRMARNIRYRNKLHPQHFRMVSKSSMYAANAMCDDARARAAQAACGQHPDAMPTHVAGTRPAAAGAAAEEENRWGLYGRETGAVVRRRVRVWSPPTDDALFDRPTLLCAVLLFDKRRFEHAAQQYQLWGRFCDDFVVFVGRFEDAVEREKIIEDDDGAQHDDTEFRKESVLDITAKYKMPNRCVRVVTLAHVAASLNAKGTPAEKKAAPKKPANAKHDRDRWQLLRAAITELDSDAPFLGTFEHVLFADDATYVVPENVYAIVAAPELHYIHGIGAPILAGNRFHVPAAVIKEQIGLHRADAQYRDDDVAPMPFITADGGILLNAGAVRLVAAVGHQSYCSPALIAAAEDVLLAKCLAAVGVVARDTADHHGHDRQLPLDLETLFEHVVDPDAGSFWYNAYRERGLPATVDEALSKATATFGGARTLADMRRLHSLVFLEDSEKSLPWGWCSQFP